MSSDIHSFSLSHNGMAMRYDFHPRGAHAAYVSRRRSNFTSGFS